MASNQTQTEVGKHHVEQALQRILASRHFRQSARLQRFLRFVVEAKLEGRPDDIQEYAVGLEVFDRGEAFDPRSDSIVRVEARRLRERLDEYYANEGRDDPLRTIRRCLSGI